MAEERAGPGKARPDPTAADPITGRRRQRGAFSIFFDAPPGASEALWETRIYHEESGEEAIFAGANPDRWLTWLLDRVRAGSDDELLPLLGGDAVEADLQVEASVAMRNGERRLAEALSLRLRVGIEGVDALQRELGASLLRLAGSLAGPASEREVTVDEPMRGAPARGGRGNTAGER
ncbi:MAG: hypothetical protein AB7W59_18700 [Acidimicrobiia bacterium]